MTLLAVALLLVAALCIAVAVAAWLAEIRR